MSGSRLSTRSLYRAHLYAFGAQLHRPPAYTQRTQTPKAGLVDVADAAARDASTTRGEA